MLDEFKAQHGIPQFNIKGEKLSQDIVYQYTSVKNSPIKISTIGLIREDVCNWDETGLNWKASPKTLGLHVFKAVLQDFELPS